MERDQFIEDDPYQQLGANPTMGHAYGLAMAKMKNGTLKHEQPADKENCTIF